MRDPVIGQDQVTPEERMQLLKHSESPTVRYLWARAQADAAATRRLRIMAREAGWPAHVDTAAAIAREVGRTWWETYQKERGDNASGKE